MNPLPALGLDIAKDSLEVRIVVNARAKKKRLVNTATGFAQLSLWLTALGVDRVHACLEATGAYGEGVAEYLVGQGHTVSVVNPARIKGHAQSQMQRQKTDAVDAEVLRHFCETQRPEAWQPPAPEIKVLRGLVRRVDDLVAMRTQETNRLQSGGLSSGVQASIEQMLAYLEQQLTELERQIQDHLNQYPGLHRQIDLLTTIPGIGERTALKLVAEFMEIARYTDARSLAASVGVTPTHHTSGTSVKGTPHISKVGNATLRGALWWPTISAMRCNPVIQSFIRPLRRAKKHNLAIILAAMRKLLHVVYGVIKHDTPFDPNWALRKA